MAAIVVAFATCGGANSTEACIRPPAGSAAEGLLATARDRVAFDLLYPCYLPNSQVLDSQAVTGEPGRQRVELHFEGPFEMALRQAQFPPPVTPDPTGASRIVVNLFPNTPATLIERNDGSTRALYHLYWERDGFFLELQALGPPLQRATILEIARSLYD